MAYKVGDLDLNIQAISNTAVQSLDTVIARLSTMNKLINTNTSSNSFVGLKNLSNALNRINKLDINSVSNKIENISTSMQSFNQQTKSLDFSSLKSMSSFVTAMKKVGDIDTKTIYSKFSSLTRILTPFVAKIKEAEASLVALSKLNNLKNLKLPIETQTNAKSTNISKYTGISNKSLSSLTKSLNFGAMLGKIKLITYSIGRLVKFTSDIVQSGVDYTETLNLWQVAMKENIGLAGEFVDKMHDAYSISTQTLMQTQAIFKNMVGSLGNISESASYSLSESLTQMALDFASLYNVTFEQAITKFQAMLAGQVRPIRSISGYDITELTLYPLYQSLGGTKSMRQLNRTEKQLLSILAVFEQMGSSGALGDMTKTLSQFANQSRMLSENWQEFTTWVGISLKMFLEEYDVLVKLNAVLITASEIAKAFAYEKDYKMPDFTNTFESVTETNEAIDELTGKLTDFDKFNVLQDSTDSTSDIEIDQIVLDALSNYGGLIDDANNKAKELSDTWLEILGLTDKNDDGVYEIGEKFEKILDKVKGIGITLGIIIGLVMVSKIPTLITNIATGIGTLFVFLGKVLKFILSPMGIFIISLAGGIALVTLGILDLIDNGVTYKNLLLIAGGFTAIGIAISILTGSWIPLVVGAIVGAVVFIGGVIYKNWEKIKEFFISLWGTIKNVTKNVITYLLTPLEALFKYYKTIYEILKAIVTFDFSDLGSTLKNIWTNWNAQKVDWNVSKFANGGTPEKGSMFIAGEAGAEIVSTSSGGQVNVSNFDQIAEAVFIGNLKANMQNNRMQVNNGGELRINIGGTNFVNITKEQLAKHGYKLVRV